MKLFFGVKRLKFFDADPGWKKFGSGIRMNIPDPQHCATLSAGHRLERGRYPGPGLAASRSSPGTDCYTSLQFPASCRIQNINKASMKGRLGTGTRLDFFWHIKQQDMRDVIVMSSLWWSHYVQCVSVFGIRIFWASWIRVRIRNLFVRIRILHQQAKKMKKNLDFYCFLVSLWLFIFEEWCKCTGPYLRKRNK